MSAAAHGGLTSTPNDKCSSCGIYRSGYDCGADSCPSQPELITIRDGDSCWMSDLRCPRCGCALNTNGRFVWCSFVGGRSERACDYGLGGVRVPYVAVQGG